MCLWELPRSHVEVVVAVWTLEGGYGTVRGLLVGDDMPQSSTAVGPLLHQEAS